MELNKELLKLQDELTSLESAVSHISRAEKLSANVVDSAKTIQNSFAIKLDEVVSHYNEFMSRTSSNTEDNISELTSTHLKLAEEVQKITEDYSKLSESTLILSDKIEGINFPNHLNQIQTKTEEVKSMLADTILGQEAYSSDLKSSINKDLDNFLAKQYEIGAKIEKLSTSINKNQKAQEKTIEEFIKQEDLNFSNLSLIIEKQSAQISTLKTFSITTFVLLVIFFVILMIK